MAREIVAFGDESGTMPSGDTDLPFCAAVLAAVGEAPVLSSRSGKRSDVVEACLALRLTPQVVYVSPRPGFGHQLSSKMSKINTMARASRLITGDHAYLPERGYSARNLLWSRCMAVCLVRAVLRTGAINSVARVRIVLDRKTFNERERALFIDRVVSQSQDIFGQSSRRYEVVALWSDDPDAEPFGDGLFLAHHVSGLARKALQSGTEEALAEQLGVPSSDLFYDATADVLAPLPPWSVEKWKCRTGLPEPSE